MGSVLRIAAFVFPFLFAAAASAGLELPLQDPTHFRADISPRHLGVYRVAYPINPL